MPGDEREQRKRVKRIIQASISIVIVVAIFALILPKIASYSSVWKTISQLTWLEFLSLVLAMLFNLFTYWWANMAALPGLSLKKAAVVTQTGTSVANTLPAGGAIAIGVTYAQLEIGRAHV